MRFQMTRDFYVPKNPTEVKDHGDGTVSYKYESFNIPAGKNVLYAMMFVGKAHKPAWHHRFKDEAAREALINETLANFAGHKARVAARRAERVAAPNPYKIGDIFRCSWGYDQTNVDYFEAVAVKGKYVTVRAICKKYVETGNMSGRCTPMPGSFATGYSELTKRCLVTGGWGIKIDNVRTASFLKPEKMIGTVPVYGTSYESHYA